MNPESAFYDYTSYVEIYVEGHNLFTWSVDLRLTSKAWELDRTVAESAKDGAVTISDFETRNFSDLESLAESLPSCLAEFLESAKQFDFDIE